MLRSIKYFCFTFLAVLLHLASEIHASSEDLYNTETVETDLNWKINQEGDWGWAEVNARDVNGKTVRNHEICDYPATKEGTFIRSPYIRAKDAERVKVEVTFSIVCFNEKNCSDTFAVYYYQADGDISNSTFPAWQESSYNKIDTLTADRNVDETKRVKFLITSSSTKVLRAFSIKSKRFYIAINNQGACLSIEKVRVFYNYCPAFAKGLKSFPRIVSGKKRLKVEGACSSNSLKSDRAPVSYCSSNGEWKSTTGRCRCEAGYERNRNGTCVEKN